jgi:hypothetical protein
MAKSKSKRPAAALDEIELHSDAWQRFEKFVETKVTTRPAPTPKPTASRAKSTTGKRPKKA